MSEKSEPKTGAVIRFPVEKRFPRRMSALLANALDARAIGILVDQWNLPITHDHRQRAEQMTLNTIAKHEWPSHPLRRNAALDGLVQHAVDKGLDACREADEAWIEAGVARAQADAASGNRLMRKCAADLDAKAHEIGFKAAWLKREAHHLCEAAQGVARAIEFAKRNEPWVERTMDDDTAWLCAAHEAAKLR